MTVNDSDAPAYFRFRARELAGDFRVDQDELAGMRRYARNAVLPLVCASNRFHFVVRDIESRLGSMPNGPGGRVAPGNDSQDASPSDRLARPQVKIAVLLPDRSR